MKVRMLVVVITLATIGAIQGAASAASAVHIDNALTTGHTGSARYAADSRNATAASRTPTVRLEQTSVGKILTDGSGFTLYTFTRDRRNRDNCTRVARCLEVWSALTTTRRPVAGPHVRSSLIGTITLHGDIKQVTYAGHPLYTYAHDFTPRSILYIGSYEYGGFWNALTAAGRPTP